MKIGKTVRHDGKLYQILKIGTSLITAYSYNESCGVESTVLISRSSGDIVAIKDEIKRNTKMQHLHT